MKEKVDVTGVPETMLQTLYARAKETKKSEMSWPVETVSGKMFYLDGAHCKTTDAAAENPAKLFYTDQPEYAIITTDK